MTEPRELTKKERTEIKESTEYRIEIGDATVGSDFEILDYEHTLSLREKEIEELKWVNADLRKKLERANEFISLIANKV